MSSRVRLAPMVSADVPSVAKRLGAEEEKYK